MLKNLLKKILYQPNFYLLLILYGFFDINQVIAYELVTGTSCYKAQTNEVVEISNGSSNITFGGNFVRYKLPAGYTNKKAEILCLKVPKYLYDTTTNKEKLVPNQYRFFPIKDKDVVNPGGNLNNTFELCLGRPGTGNKGCNPDEELTSLSSCEDKITNKFYSSLTNETYPDIDSCKFAVDLDQIPIIPVETSDVCYELPDYNGLRSIAFYDGNILGSGSFNETCQCYTQDGEGLNSHRNVGIYYREANGTIREYASLDEAQTPRNLAGTVGLEPEKQYNWFIAAKRCHQENTRKFFNSTTGGCFNTKSECRQTICDTGDKGKYRVNGTFVTFQDVLAEVRSGNIQPNATLDRCDCSVAYNQNYTPLLCASALPGAICDEACKIVPARLDQLQPIEPLSPLAFINVLANFLFWFAVILFVVNFVTAGLEMVRSGDEPEKMKEATERITSSIFGFIFVLIASGLINYLIDFLNDYIQ